MSVVQRRSRVAVALVALFLLAYLVFSLFPFYWMVNTSLKAKQAAYQTPPQFVPHRPTLINYGRLLNEDIAVLRFFLNSMIVGTGTVALCIAAGGAGRLLAGALPGAGAPLGDGVHPDEPDVPDGAAVDTDLHLLRAPAAARYARGGDPGARRHRPAVQRVAAEGLHRHRAARDRGGGGDRRQQQAGHPGAHRQPDDRAGPGDGGRGDLPDVVARVSVCARPYHHAAGAADRSRASTCITSASCRCGGRTSWPPR